MTVANNYAPIRQLGNGSTVQYSAAWSMIAATYALVQLENVTTGARTTLTQGVGANQYQISITSSGFTVTLGQPATSSNYVNVSRVTDLSQTDSYRTSKGFQGEVEENSFDKLTAMVQDAAYRAGLAITIPSGETTGTVLPSASLRANTFVGFDVSGNVAVFAGVSSIAISSAMVPVVQATTLALARTAMGVAGLADNNTFTGTNAFPTPAALDSTTKPATMAALARDAVTYAEYVGIGWVNKFRNPAFEIAQRGTSGTVSNGTTAVTIDGWGVGPNGNNLSWSQVDVSINSVTTKALNLTGAASITSLSVQQRIESYVGRPLCGKTCTIQYTIFNNSGGAFTPTLDAFYANAQDNFGAVTQFITSQSLQSCPNGAFTTVAFTFNMPAAAHTGMLFNLGLGSALNSGAKTAQILAADLRATPGITTGLNSSPPPVELRPFPAELAFCQRYLYVINNNSGAPGRWTLGFGNSATSIIAPFTFPVPPRITNAAVSLLSGNWNLELCSSLGAVVAMTSANVFANMAAPTATVSLQLVTAGGLTSGVAYFGQLPSGGGAIAFIMEL